MDLSPIVEQRFPSRVSEPPRCPMCDGVTTGHWEHYPPSICIECDPADPKTHRRYEPCLHVVEVSGG